MRGDVRINIILETSGVHPEASDIVRESHLVMNSGTLKFDVILSS